MIETERLLITRYDKKYLDDLCLFLLDEKQMHYIPEHFRDRDSVSKFMEESQDKFYLVVLKKEDKVIGHLSFEPFFSDHSYEIGWVFNQAYTKCGYAYEAAYALLNYGFSVLNVHRVIATAQPENTASWVLMEKLNMRREAHFKKCIPYHDTWWDEYYYAILESEWI